MKYLIKTNLGYFRPKSKNYITKYWFSAKRINTKTTADCYFDSICSDISMINKIDITAKRVRILI